MADEPRPAGGPASQPPEENGEPRSRLSWWDWCLVGLLSALGAVVRRLGWRPATPAADPPTPHPAGAVRGERLPPEEIRHPDGRIEHPRVGREKSDVSLAWVLAIVVGASCIAAVHYYGFWRLFWWRAAAEREAKQPPQALTPLPSTTLPAEPRLEQLSRFAGVPRAGAAARLAEQERTLQRYGAADEKGFVHVPIGRAIEQVTTDLPIRKEPPADSRKGRGLVDWGESNSGRMLRGAGP